MIDRVLHVFSKGFGIVFCDGYIEFTRFEAWMIHFESRNEGTEPLGGFTAQSCAVLWLHDSLVESAAYRRAWERSCGDVLRH